MDERRIETAAARFRVTQAGLLPGPMRLVVPAVTALICLGLLVRRDTELPVVALSLLITVRGALLHRPATARRLLGALLTLAAAAVVGEMGHVLAADALLLVAAVLAVRPAPPPPAAEAADRAHAARLVARSHADPLAPFALRTDKALVFSPDGAAALGYRVRCGVAVVGGDPVGDAASAPAAVTEFLSLVAAHGWRPAVLGAGPASRELWSAHGLRTVAFGRDVVVDVDRFTMSGRRFRNLRQAVQRAANAGLTTTVVREGDLVPAARTELTEMVSAAGKSSGRSFSMMLDGLFDGRHPDALLVMGRDPTGSVVALQRFAVAGGGTDLSLDLPWRLRGAAPGGADEALTAEMISWGRSHGAQRISLAFAAFPGIFAAPARGVGRRAVLAAVRLLDPLIHLKSLHTYLSKFHSLGAPRFVALYPTDAVAVLVAMVSLEFAAR